MGVESKKNKKSQGLACMARVSSGQQCSRPRKSDVETDYCGCHVKHLPYGRFDGPVEGRKFMNMPKKRGPQFKNGRSKEVKINDVDNDLYVKTILIQVDDTIYLIDESGVLYTNDQKGQVVGIRQGDYISWFV